MGYVVNLAVFSYSFKAIIDFGKHLVCLVLFRVLFGFLMFS